MQIGALEIELVRNQQKITLKIHSRPISLETPITIIEEVERCAQYFTRFVEQSRADQQQEDIK